MKNKAVLVFILALILSVQQVAQGQPLLEELQNDFEEAFKLVEDADLNSGDISELVNELNYILELLKYGDEADLNEAALRIGAVKESALSSQMSGQESTQSQLMSSGLILLITGILVAIIWRFMPKIVWQLWIRSKKDWIIS